MNTQHNIELKRIVNDLERCAANHREDEHLDEAVEDLRVLYQQQQEAPPVVQPEIDNPQSMTVTFFNSRVCEVQVLTTAGRVIDVHTGETTPKFSVLLTQVLWSVCDGLMLTKSGKRGSHQHRIANVG